MEIPASRPEAIAPERARPPLVPLWVGALALGLAFVRFGYGFGFGDQDELIPSVMRLLDPSLFPEDWLISTVAGTINVRTFFLFLVALPSVVLPLGLSTLLLWIGVAIMLSYAVHALAWEILRDRISAAVAVVVALVITVRFTVGGNALMSSMLTPEGVAWPLALFGIAFFLRGNEVAAGASLGLATWFHLLAGLHPVLLIGVAALVGGRHSLATLVRFGLSYGLAALPILVPVAVDLLTASAHDPDGVSPFYVHANFRNPFHHLLSSVPPGQLARFGITMLAGIASGVILYRRRSLHHTGFLVIVGITSVILIGAGAVLVELYEVSLVMKLQFQKMTVLLVLGASITIAGILGKYVLYRLRRYFDVTMKLRGVYLVVVMIVFGSVAALSVMDVFLSDRVPTSRHKESDLFEVERWISTNTPPEALFAIPPSVSTFRTHARRSVFANYAGFVFTDHDMQTWFDRLTTVAPIEPPEQGFEAKELLDAAYYENTTEQWLNLRTEHRIDHLLVEAEREPGLILDLLFENETWRVFAIPSGPGG